MFASFINNDILTQAIAVWEEVSSFHGESNLDLVPDYRVLAYKVGVSLGSSRERDEVLVEDKGSWFFVPEARCKCVSFVRNIGRM